MNKDASSSRFYLNPKKSDRDYPSFLNDFLSMKDAEEAYNEIIKWQKYTPTSLVPLKNMAASLGIESIYYKDESKRFNLGSFKALGGAYGVMQYLKKKIQEKITTDVSTEDIRRKKYVDLTQDLVVTTATDGNHGRSVAYGASLFGCKCRIFIHSEVSEGRKRAMEKFGAEVIRVRGNYDDSLRECINEANKNNWQIISDTSYEGYTEYPRFIMAGYTVLAREIVNQLSKKSLPTHIFLQAGVGGFAAAMCTIFLNEWGGENIKIIVVEPNYAPCLIESAIDGEPKVFDIKKETIMTGLSCGEPSILAWEILSECTDLFMTIGDDKIPELMRIMANGYENDIGVEAGECSVSGLAALVALKDNKWLVNKLDINDKSRVLLIGTEGATDPDIYERIIQN